MRHGDALPQGSQFASDNDRTLSPYGRIQVSHVAQALKDQQIRPDGVFSSPLVRTWQTAEIMARVLGVTHLAAVRALAPNQDLKKVRARILEEKANSLLLISHHPDLTSLLALLTSQSISACPQFQTASIAAITWDKTIQSGRLLWLQTSEQLSGQQAE